MSRRGVVQVTVVLVLLAGASLMVDGRWVAEVLGAARSQAHDLGAWTPAVLVAVQAATVVFVPLPAAPVTFVDVVSFGPWQGLALGLMGTVGGSVAAFLLGRRFGWSVVRQVATARTIDRFSAFRGSTDGFWLVSVLWVPVPVFGDLACYLAGLQAMPTRRFVLLAVVGRLPSTGLGVLVASGITTGSVVWLTVGLVGFAAFAAALRYGRLDNLVRN